MTNFYRYESGLNVRPLVSEIKKAPSLWKRNTQRQNAPETAHKATESIYLRGPREWTQECYQSLGGAVNYPVSKKILSATWPLVHRVLSLTENGEVGYVMIVNLKAGGYISPHIDEGEYAAHYDRFHIPLVTNDMCEFFNGDEVAFMKEGELWDFNHLEVHSFFNEGTTDRWHLIVDAH